MQVLTSPGGRERAISDGNMKKPRAAASRNSRRQIVESSGILVAHPAPSSASSTGIAGPLLRRKYQDLTRQHLDELCNKLFTDFTGLHFHITWAPTPTHEWDDQTLPTGCSVCCRISGARLHPSCKICGPKQLSITLRSNGDGHRFTCRHGVRNFWMPLRVRNETLGIAYLQALDHIPDKRSPKGSSIRFTEMVISERNFTRAARLLRFVVAHAQTASLADLRKAELTNAGRTVLALEKEQARLHDTLERHLPLTTQSARPGGPESRPEQLVHQLIEFIECNYGKPFTLRNCARKLGMNPAYLSDLFSHTVGVPFKTHLTALRMAKAKELLNDPARNLSEVAAAVGYNSENRFRIAFKNATGLSPTLWRESLQLIPPATAKR